MTRTRQDGFTLTELLIAMLVTLLVSGAVFGLMTSGQGAFRREPAITDRQQNIRMAMDLLQRDISTGGAGMPAFQQVFSPYHLGTTQTLNGRGPAGVQAGQNSDFLEVFGNDGQCPDVAIQDKDGVNLVTMLPVPACYGEDQFVLVVYPDGTSGWGFAHEIHGPDGTKVNFPSGLPPIPTSNIPGTPPFPQVPTSIQRIQLVRYEIAGEPEPGCPACPQIPGLWRSATGGYSTDNVYYPANSPNRSLGFWQLVARGVEDLQVRYHMADGRWLDTPLPLLAAGSYPDIVKDVEVTLWARALGQNLQGNIDAPGLPATDPARRAVRGSLVSVTTPRAALLALRDPGAGPNQWR